MGILKAVALNGEIYRYIWLSAAPKRSEIKQFCGKKLQCFQNFNTDHLSFSVSRCNGLSCRGCQSLLSELLYGAVAFSFEGCRVYAVYIHQCFHLLRTLQADDRFGQVSMLPVCLGYTALNNVAQFFKHLVSTKFESTPNPKESDLPFFVKKDV